MLESLRGAWAVMNGRVEGLRQLDCSIEGFWRSFGAVLLIIPMALISARTEFLLVSAGGGEVGSIGYFLTLRMLVVVLDWLAFPLVFALLSRPLGVAGNYVPFIVARNWSSVIMALLLVGPDLLFNLGLLPAELLAIVQLILVGVMIWFGFRIARTALAVPVAVAIPVVLLQLLLSFIVAIGVGRLA